MFKTPLSLTANVARPDFWFLAAPLVWESPTLSITVPKGFRTDLASIPHILEAIPDLDVNGLSRRPGALHDWLYGAARWITKAGADALLYEALLAEGMSKNGATAIYEGVHLFGEEAWAEDGTESVKSMFATEAQYFDWLATGPQLNPAP
jgi:hypothetical protein